MKCFNWIKNNTYYLKGKKIIVTGATGDLGYNICNYLAFLEADVVMAVRNIERGEQVKMRILADYPKASITVEKIDVSLFSSIDEFIEIVNEKHTNTYALINNAGIYYNEQVLTPDGLEIHFMTNFLGPFYLSESILPIINANSGKIINISSIAYDFSLIDFNDVEGFREKSKIKVYGKTKRLLNLSTLYMQKEYKEKYPNVRIMLTHPGISATNLFLSKGNIATPFFKKIIVPIMKVVFNKPEKASLCIIKAVFEDELVTNSWIGPSGFKQVWGYPKQHVLSKSILNMDTQKRAYEVAKTKIAEVKASKEGK